MISDIETLKGGSWFREIHYVWQVCVQYTYHANARGNRVHDTEELAFVESSLSEAVHFNAYRVFTGGEIGKKVGNLKLNVYIPNLKF